VFDFCELLISNLLVHPLRYTLQITYQVNFLLKKYDEQFFH